MADQTTNDPADTLSTDLSIERGDRTLAWYAINAMHDLADVPENHSLRGQAMLIDVYLPGLLADLFSLAADAGLDWAHMFAEAERTWCQERGEPAGAAPGAHAAS
jgi:hypothetical protein